MNLPSCQPGELWVSLKPENGWSSPCWKLPPFPCLLYKNQRAKLSRTSPIPAQNQASFWIFTSANIFPRSRAITVHYLDLSLLLASMGWMQRRTNSIALVCLYMWQKGFVYLSLIALLLCIVVDSWVSFMYCEAKWAGIGEEFHIIYLSKRRLQFKPAPTQL